MLNETTETFDGSLQDSGLDLPKTFNYVQISERASLTNTTWLVVCVLFCILTKRFLFQVKPDKLTCAEVVSKTLHRLITIIYIYCIVMQ